MKRSWLIYGGLLGVGLVLAVPAPREALVRAIWPGWKTAEKRFTLPNGWRLTPAGHSIPLPGDMPGNILILDGGRKALVNTCGFHDHSLNLIDVQQGKLLESVPFDRSWVGLAEVGGDILVSGGKVEDPAKNEAVHRLRVGENIQRLKGFGLSGIAPKEQFVSSILPGPDGMYVLNVQSDEILRLGADGTEQARNKVGYRPYAAALSPDLSTLAVSNWGDKSVALLDPKTLKTFKTIAVDALPCALLYSPDGRLFVANSGSNMVSVIDKGRVTERIRTGIDRTNRIGSTPVALAIQPNGKTLYVANAGNNCVTVVSIAKRGDSAVRGFIPTERYPTAVAVTPDGKRLLVATAKGYYGPNAGKAVNLTSGPVRGKDVDAPFRYIGDQLQGHLAIIEMPDAKALAAYTRQTLANAPLGLASAPSESERKAIERDAFKKIKHVIYVIRENRTFDQVLGDIGKGNCDPELTIFGKEITPNGHKIANEFVLFDNLYTDGETSQLGHQWTDAAYANDYAEKQMIVNYSRRGEIESDTRLTSSPGEYIWTLARKHGLAARVYGEYVNVQEDHGSLEPEAIKKDPEKYGFSESFERIFARNGRDPEKVDDFLKELKAAEKTGKWPALMVMALPEDHTHGFSPGAFTPSAMIASNDLAIGKLVDAVSHSSFWSSTAIFIIQDDAQDGPDHVDSHRTVAYVVSPYTRRGIVDSTMYSTASMLRTMELILGLPPMSQYDGNATPMYRAFGTKLNPAPFNLVPPKVDINAKNPAGTELARWSSKLDFSDIDRADFDELNRLLWAAYGKGRPYPAPVRGR